MSIRRHGPVWALLAALLGVTAGAWAAPSARLERDRVADGETVRLLIEAGGQVSGRPDTRPLEQDFDVLGVASGSRVNIMNGRMEASTTWTLTLAPKRTGRLTIPPLEVDGQRTPTLTLEVTQAPVTGSAAGADIFIETQVDPDTPYVQGMVLYTLRIYHAVRLAEGQLSDLDPANALVRRMGEDRQDTVNRDGRRYRMIERRYALFPQASGELTLPGVVLDAQVPERRRRSPLTDFFGRDPFDDFLTSTRRVRVRGESHTLFVRPRPAEAQGAHWLPAENVELVEQWLPPDGPVRVGDPVSRSLTIRARGLTGAQLPALVPDPEEGMKVYPDQARTDTRDLTDGVVGEKTQGVAFVPTRAGTFTLPSVHLRWWDTQADRERLAELPARMLQVLPAAGTQAFEAPSQESAERPPAPTSMSPGPPVVTPSSDGQAAAGGVRDTGAVETPAETDPWRWVSLALGALWLATLALWLRGWPGRGRDKKATSPAPDRLEEGPARTRFQKGCREGNGRLARRGLLEWAAAHWPGDPPRGLQELATRLDDPPVRQMLTELDRSLYREEGGEWDGKPLAHRLRQLPKALSVGGRPSPLPELYP